MDIFSCVFLSSIYLYIGCMFAQNRYGDIESPLRIILWPLVVIRFVIVNGVWLVYYLFTESPKEVWEIIKRG